MTLFFFLILVPCDSRITIVIEQRHRGINGNSSMRQFRPLKRMRRTAPSFIHLMRVKLQHLQIEQQQFPHFVFLFSWHHWKTIDKNVGKSTQKAFFFFTHRKCYCSSYESNRFFVKFSIKTRPSGCAAENPGLFATPRSYTTSKSSLFSYRRALPTLSAREIVLSF